MLVAAVRLFRFLKNLKNAMVQEHICSWLHEMALKTYGDDSLGTKRMVLILVQGNVSLGLMRLYTTVGAGRFQR